MPSSLILATTFLGSEANGERASQALDVWHIDYAGPLVESKGCTQILVVVDAFSKYCCSRPAPRNTFTCAVQTPKVTFRQVIRPKWIIADRAAAFISPVFTPFLNDAIGLSSISTLQLADYGAMVR